MPGRTMSRPTLTAVLEPLHLENVSFAPWQIDYDLVWAHKATARSESASVGVSGGAPMTLPYILRCPHCSGTPLTRRDNAYACEACDSQYRIADDGVVEMGS
jgi:hypothetical protein